MEGLDLSPSQSTTFLTLPAEIRIQVYTLLFRASRISIESPHTNSPSCGFNVCSCAFPWHILHTCRQLRAEALPYLLSATTLEMSGSLVKSILIPPHYLSAIPRAVVLDAKAFSAQPFRLDLFNSLKTLELRNITIWCKYHDEMYLASEEGNASMIGLAMFNLNRISNLLTALCDQVGRAFSIRLCCQYVVSSLTHETIHAVIDVDTKAVLHKSRGPTIRDRNAWAGFY